ncbi:RNA polymerase subunit sigma-70 [Mucilaginibacter sp. PPCGB 2223]|uniref:RNA polymerase sigma factor n=1 Tax=Mucilaginibacter sp. PPCGB 2223 TaxID=1886027 RepID=UPI0008263768|nr:sigma-70 family RNA polymerase sigma factor [Mucilaginibacter sp. PPCGB 2223]OCX53772.1 RNA polymerase subunit sigma-70 [Mucilaginibacter sp. PPCGB 2223]
MNFLKSSKKPDDRDDERLLQEYRQTGDLALLAALYQKYMHLVFGVCLKYLKDDELSKDAVMQIFEELIVKVNKHDIRQFKSWLYVLSRNYCLMQLRSGKKMQTDALDDIMELAEDLHHDDDREEDLAALERCKEKLPPAQKLSIQLFYIEEKCYKEIAEDTGYSMNEVKSYIQNGKRNLKICLEKNRER